MFMYSIPAVASTSGCRFGCTVTMNHWNTFICVSKSPCIVIKSYKVWQAMHFISAISCGVLVLELFMKEKCCLLSVVKEPK